MCVCLCAGVLYSVSFFFFHAANLLINKNNRSRTTSPFRMRMYTRPTSTDNDDADNDDDDDVVYNLSFIFMFADIPKSKIKFKTKQNKKKAIGSKMKAFNDDKEKLVFHIQPKKRQSFEWFGLNCWYLRRQFRKILFFCCKPEFYNSKTCISLSLSLSVNLCTHTQEKQVNTAAI